MNPNAEDQSSLLDDIERRVGEIFSAQKSEVEQSLVERINREKEEAQKRIEAVNQEFAQVRSFLEKHKTAMAGLQTTEEHLRGEIRGHFERAVNYQKMMEHAAVLAGGELEKIGGLNEEIGRIRGRAESIYAELKTHLAGYAGLMAQIPAPAPKSEEDLDWTAEIDKLRKVRDLLATLRPAGLGEDEAGEQDEPATDEAAPSVPAAEAAEELAASLGLIGPEDDGTSDDIAFLHDDENAVPVPGVPAEEAAAAVHAVLERMSVRDRLVLTLMYLEECSVAETARLTGWSQTMVKVQAHRARGRLKKLLQQGRTER